jgi:hypothetical protein
MRDINLPRQRSNVVRPDGSGTRCSCRGTQISSSRAFFTAVA